MHLEYTELLQEVLLLGIINAFHHLLDAWDLEECLFELYLFLANEVLLDLLQVRWSLNDSIESISYQFTAKLTANQLDVLVIVVDVLDEVG